MPASLHVFLVMPIFGLANAGISFADLPIEALTAALTLGFGLGLLVGMLGASLLAIRLGLADFPAYDGQLQLASTVLLYGIGFTMSPMITRVAFQANPLLPTRRKDRHPRRLAGGGTLGYLLLWVAQQDWPGKPNPVT